MDAGDIISQQAVPLPRGYPMPLLYDDLSRSGSVQLAEAIDAIESNTAPRLPQNPAEATQEPPPTRRTWRVEFDCWSAERTWHFLSGIGSTYGSLCRDPSGADMPLGRSAMYSRVQHAKRPGTWERMRDGSVILYCSDGTVTSVP
jgi:methionyl-tRNA formyltransferase